MAHPPGTPPVIGIIGGSGIYDLTGLTETRWVTVDTPWGRPSDELYTGVLPTPAGPLRMVFLPRHGRGHRPTTSSSTPLPSIARTPAWGICTRRFTPR